MIRIGICDDVKQHRDRLKDLCECYFITHPMEHDYAFFSTGKEVLVYQGESMCLLFLDIEMGESSGLDVLESLRESDMIWRIAFASSHVEHMIDTIDIKTLAFLNKPLQREGVEKCLDIAIRESEQNVSIAFKVLDGNKSVKLGDLIYIQADKHYVNVFARPNGFTGYNSLKQLEEQLQGTTMVRIHKSYLVNMQYINRIMLGEVCMSDGTRLPIGRKYNSSVKESFYRFVKAVTYQRNDIK